MTTVLAYLTVVQVGLSRDVAAIDSLFTLW